MLRRLEESSSNVLGWEVTGKVTDEEVRTLSEEFKAAIAEHAKVRVLVRMRRIPRMELAAWVEDFKLTPYAKDVERYAIVSDSNLFEWTSKIAQAFIGGEVRRFEDSRYEEAWRWLRS
jgi:SpoIIAA-like